MKHKILFGVFATVGSFGVVMAQPPAPPPVPPPDQSVRLGSPTSTVSGRISQFNYGPDGRAQGLIVANTLVVLPPDWAMQMELTAKTGDQVSVTGFAAPAALSGMQIMQPRTMSIAGKTLSLAQSSQPAPYAGSGVIRALNYGAQGEVNGFVLQNGIIALTPPMGTSDVSVVKPGASISFSGLVHTGPAGRNVVNVQSITANGQTIALNAAPPAPGPGRGPGRAAGPPPFPPAAPPPAPLR